MMATKHEKLTVYGYIRQNIGQKMIDVIIETIIQFYMFGGGSLYVFGSGSRKGCLGIKEYKNKLCKIPTLCVPFDQNNTLDISAGHEHTLILDIDGSVWCCGRGKYGALGTGTTTNALIPTKLKLDNKAISVSGGRTHSLILLQSGLVQSFGSNSYGQLGHDISLKKSLVPKTIETLKKYKIVQVSAGGYFSAALTKVGDLFCFGDNSYGQCGVGKEKGNKIMPPTKVDLDDKIAFIDCGSNHTLLISCNHFIYSFGFHVCGRLGHGDYCTKWTPKMIEALKQMKMTTCAAGDAHSLCIDEEGIIWSFGDNEHGQCGLSLDVKYRFTPKKIDWFIANNIKAIDCAVCGYQSCVIAEDECLYVFGSNTDYQLALKERHYYTPQRLSFSQNFRVQKVSMGYFHTAVIGVM